MTCSITPHPTRYGDAHLSNEASVPTPQAATMRSRLPSGPWLAVIAAVSWIAVCLAAVGWFYLRSVDPAVCPADGDYAIFCRANQADVLLANIGKVGIAFVAGSVVLSAIVIMERHPRARGRQGARGQSMVEFALIGPLFFFLVFGIVEFGVMMFDITTTRFASGEAARVEAQAGALASDCRQIPGCGALYGPGYGFLYAAQGCDLGCQATVPTPAPLCDADCKALVAAHSTALGSTSLERINYVDIQQMQANSDGTFSPVAGNCQRYNWNGTYYVSGATPDPGACSNYPGTGRNVVVGSMDYLQVNINFTYRWLTAMFSSVAKSPTLDSKFVVRLEPQKFAPPAAVS